jgi:hypothetical protein
MRSLRATLLMVAGWMSLLAARPIASADSERELSSAAAVDVSLAAPVIRYAVVSDMLVSARASRVTPLALFVCAAALLLLTGQTVERARVAAHSPPKVIDPRVVPYDAMAPPILLVSSSAAI